MKKLLGVALTILAQVSMYSQSPVIQWEKSFGGSLEDNGFDIKVTNDGGYIMVGTTLSSDAIPLGNHHGNYDVYVVKTTSTGIVEWQKTIGGSNYDVGTSVFQTTDNGYIISGYTSSNDGDIISNFGFFDCLVIKLDALGNIQWNKTYGGSGFDSALDLVQTSDGGYVIAGNSGSSDGHVTQNLGDSDIWIVKIDALGTIVWEKSIGGSANDLITAISKTSDDGYLLVGHTFSNDGDITQNQGSCEAWLLKLNSAGAIEWQKTYGGSEGDYLYDIKQTQEGGYITCGQTESANGNLSTNYGASDAWIMKLSSLGEIEWSKTYGGSSDDDLAFIGTAQDGKYIFCGGTYSNDFDVAANNGGYDCWLLKILDNGDVDWNKTYGGSLNDGPNGLKQTSDGGSVFVGYAYSNNLDVSQNSGIHDMWLVKLSPHSLSNETFEHDGLNVFPNPTTNLLNLQAVDSLFIDTIKVTDIAGKTIMLITQNTKQINISTFAQGLYFLEVIAGSKTYQTKFIKQ